MDARVTDEDLLLFSCADTIEGLKPKGVEAFKSIALELWKLRAQSSWVKVSERLPGPGGDTVQVWGTWRKRDKPQVVEAYVFPLRGGRNGCTFGPVHEGVFPKRVTHWLYIPKPPEEEVNG